MPLSEIIFHKDNVRTTDIFNDGCTIPELDDASPRCTYMNSTIQKLSLIGGDQFLFVISSNYLGSEKFVKDTIKLAESVTSNGSQLLVMLPTPRYPALDDRSLINNNLCKKEWFRPGFALSDVCGSGFETSKSDWLAEINFYQAQLEEYSLHNNKFFVYSPFEDLCVSINGIVDNSCSPFLGDKLLYFDSSHLSVLGAKALYPRFRSFLLSNGLLPESY